MMSKRALRTIVSAFSGLALLSGVALAAEFTPAQKKEIEQIIRGYLLDHPEILTEMVDKLEKRQKAAKRAQEKAVISAHADALFRSGGDLVIGNPKGKVAMVEFFDYNCGFCKRSLPDVIKLKETNPDLKIIIKEFPILGPGSMEAARYALAARKQGMDKYWKLHAALLKHRGQVNGDVVLKVAKDVGLDVEKLKEDSKSPEIDKTLDLNLSLANALGIRGTPAFVIGDKLVPGALGYKKLNAVISEVRKKGCKVC